MEEEDHPRDARQEEALLGRLVEAVRGLKDLQSLRDRRREAAAEGGCPAGEEGGRGAGDGGGGKGEDKDEVCKLLRLLREVSVSHSVRAASWREALRECVCVLARPPPEGSDQQPVLTGDSGESLKRDAASQVVKVQSHITFSGRDHQDTLVRILLSVEEDVGNVTDTLVGIVAKLSEEVLQFQEEEPGDATSPEQLEGPLSGHIHLGLDASVTSRPLDAQPAEDSSSNLEEKGTESLEDNTHSDGVQDNQRDEAGGTSGKPEDGALIVGWVLLQTRSPKRFRSDSVFPSLYSRLGCWGVPDVCFVRGPPGLAAALRCELADALSCLMVRGSEELVSRVIRLQVREGAHLLFPVTVVVPFCGSYRGSYRDVLVKVVDERGGRSYVTPLATEGTYGGQWVRCCHGFGFVG